MHERGHERAAGGRTVAWAPRARRWLARSAVATTSPTKATRETARSVAAAHSCSLPRSCHRLEPVGRRLSVAVPVARCEYVSVSLAHRDCSWFAGAASSAREMSIVQTFRRPGGAGSRWRRRARRRWARCTADGSVPSTATAASGAELARRRCCWLASARQGSCGVTSDRGDCSGGDRGSLGLAEGEVATREAAEACLLRCSACDACRFVALSVAARGAPSSDAATSTLYRFPPRALPTVRLSPPPRRRRCRRTCTRRL